MMFIDSPVRDVLLFLERAARRTMEIDSGVQGKISISLQGRSWREALDAEAQSANLTYTVEDSLIRVAAGR